jgi:selenocysteine lyase/cysteine desulfurase
MGVGGDVLPTGLPTLEGCEVSRWEMGTLPYESLAGFAALVAEYYRDPGLLGASGKLAEDAAASGLSLRSVFAAIQSHERELSKRFIDSFQKLGTTSGTTQSGGWLQLHGSTDPDSRTPTFAVSVQGENAGQGTSELCEWLNQEGIFCTYGNHYAPALVYDGLEQAADGWVRLSFLHYNTGEDVDRAVDALGRFWAEKLN